MIINYGKHLIDKDDIQSVIKSLSGNNITQGENITKFESALNIFFGSKYSSVVSSGTAASSLSRQGFELVEKRHSNNNTINFF